MQDKNLSSSPIGPGPGSHRLPTGVSRLDTILMGGLIASDMYIVYGGPGTGKSVLCNQICFHQIRTHQAKCLYLTLVSESPADMVGHLKAFTFFDESLIPESLHMTSGYGVIKKGGADSLLHHLKNLMMKQGTNVLVFEGIEQLFYMLQNPIEFIDFIKELGLLARMVNCTVILTSYTSGIQLGFGLADGIIEMTNSLEGMRQIRELTIHKLRGSDYLGGRHKMEITNQGIVLHPRLESIAPAPGRAATLQRQSLRSGNEFLDRTMHGGLLSESSMVILGELGTGKTTLGLSFLVEGARAGQQGIYLGFSEPPEQIIRKAEVLEIPLRKSVEDGLIHIMWQPPTELLLDTLPEKLMDFLGKKPIAHSRIFLDSLGGLLLTTANQDRMPLFTSAMLHQLRSEGATTVISSELPITAGAGIVGSGSFLDNICESIVRLRYIRHLERFYRFFNIVKMRESDYDPVSVPFRIGKGGLVFEELKEEHKMALRSAPVEF